MKIETVSGEWINSRFILTTFVENSHCVSCKLYNGDIHGLYKDELITKRELDTVVEFIANAKLNNHLLPQKEIKEYVNRICR